MLRGRQTGPNLFQTSLCFSLGALGRGHGFLGSAQLCIVGDLARGLLGFEHLGQERLLLHQALSQAKDGLLDVGDRGIPAVSAAQEEAIGEVWLKIQRRLVERNLGQLAVERQPGGVQAVDS